MKRIFCGLICLSMLCSLSIPALAQKNEFELTYKNDATYEINIPASGDIDTSSGKGTIKLSIDDAKLEEGTVVQISASSENCDGETWYLVNEKNPSSKIAYTISVGNTNVQNNGRVFSSADGLDISINVSLSDTTKIGTFTDTITFTSDIVEIIDFEIDEYFDIGGIVQAEEGMTWREWVNSSYNTFGYVIGDGTNENVVCVWVDEADYYMYITDEEYNNINPDEEIIENKFYINNY